MKCRPGVALPVLLCLILTAVPAFASDDDSGDGTPDNPYLVPRIEVPVRIDGVLSEEIWDRALTLELNYEIEPGENTPAPVRTQVMLLYGSSHVYIAWRCFDPDPSAIRAHLTDRDDCYSDDIVAIKFDTFNDERGSFTLYSNPLGVQVDRREHLHGVDFGWDAIYDNAARIYDWGYAVEMAIPFRSLRFQRTSEEQVWGIDIIRSYPRTTSHWIALFPRDRNNDCYYCQFVKIKGFAGADPGYHLEVNPTVTANRTDSRDELPGGQFDTAAENLEAGITASWGFTSNLTLGATANPDFSQVEADMMQLDINQTFALYYPERRPFFVEGSNIFDLRMDAVHTRAMHDPAWGLKLTGKEGANTVGALVVQDEVTNLIFPGSRGSTAASMGVSNSSSVIRYARDFGNDMTLGGLFTNRQSGDYFNRLLGFDGDFRLTGMDRIQLQVLGSSTQYPNSIAAEFDQPLGDFSDTALQVLYTRSARDLSWTVLYSDVGAGFRADLGFMPRVDYRLISASVDYHWIAGPQTSWYTDLFLDCSYEHMEDHDGSLITKGADVYFTYLGPLQSHSYVGYSRTTEGYNGALFEGNSFALHHGMNPNADSNAGITVSFGDAIDYANSRAARFLNVRNSLTYNAFKRLLLSYSLTYERLTVECGRLYTANIFQLTSVYQFNVHAFFRAILQYRDYRYNTGLYTFEIDPAEKGLFTQFLFSYKLNPRTVLFIGYSDNYFGNQDFSLAQTSRTFFVKLGYAWTL